MGTLNTREILESLPVYLKKKKAFYVLPLKCEVARAEQRGWPLAFALGGYLLPKTSRAAMGQFGQTGFYLSLAVSSPKALCCRPSGGTRWAWALTQTRKVKCTKRSPTTLCI